MKEKEKTNRKFKMSDLSSNKSIIVLLPRQWFTEQISQHASIMLCVQKKKKKKETHFNYNDVYRFKVKGWKKIYCKNFNKRKTGMAVLILNKSQFN